MRWRSSAKLLLCGAALLGAATAAPAATWFEDVTVAAGIAPLRHGEGVNFVDLDGDDFPDLYLPSVREPGRLLRNRQDGTFRDVTAQAGTSAQGGVGAACGDLDGDGRSDIYVARGADPYVAPNIVYLQQTDGSFKDAATMAGVGDKPLGLTVTLADFDADGDLDPFLPGWGRDVLYRNDGGRLVEVDAGLASGGRGWAAVAADFDHDGQLDLFVAHGSPTTPRDNRLYRNLGKLKFADVTVESGLAASPWSLGPVAADFDNDGDLDLYVAGYHGPGKLYRNDGGMQFTDVTAASSLTAAKAVGATAGPIDGDLLPDLVVGGFGGPVELYRNRGGMTFVKVTESGLDKETRNEGVALTDYDADGDLDLYVTNVGGQNRLYRNLLNDQRFLKLRFPTGGAPTIGAVARLGRNGQVLATQWLFGAVGMGQGAQELIFRLPDDGPFDLEVVLPDGRKVVREKVAAGVVRVP